MKLKAYICAIPAALFAVLLAVSPAGSGALALLGAGKPAAAAGGFTGPLDVSGLSTNVIACYSLRACSSALRGNALINACNSTGGVDVGCADLLSDATTGALVPATVSGITCPGANCTIKIWYDQTASNACGSASCDMITAGGVVASRPTLPASVLGSFAVGRMTTSQGLGSLNNLTQAQPATLSSVSRRTSGTGLNIMFGGGSANPALLFDASTAIELFAGSGTVAAGTGAENAWHNIAGFFNGASSVGYVDGAAGSAVNPGSNGFNTTPPNVNNPSFPTNLESVENIIWSADKSSSMAALCTNQFGYWGTAVSC